MDCPCYNCKDREPGCNCDAFKAWRDLRIEDQKRRVRDALLNDYRDVCWMKGVRRNNKKPRGKRS